MSTPKMLLIFAAILVLLKEAKTQGVGVGVETPNPNAVLELVSPGNNQGLLVPKLTTTQRTATAFTSNLTASENGLLVYDTDLNAFYFWINSQWVSMQTAVNLTAGEGIEITDGEISNTGDLDATNEIQDIEVVGTELTISGGSTIDLSFLDTNTQLTEAEVDAFADNNGYLQNESDPSVPANLKDGVDWNEIASIPADLADGDQNTQLTESEVDAFVQNNGFLTVADVAGYDTDVTDDFSGDFADLQNVPTGVSDGDDVEDADADPANEIQDLELDGNLLRITNNPSSTDIDLAPFMGANTDEQTLSLVGTDLSISGGNTIDLGPIDTDTQLSDGEIAAFGYIKTETDDQTINLSSTTLSIEGGNSVNLDVLQDGFEANTDEQDLSVSGGNLNISGGTGVSLALIQDGTGTDDQEASEVDVASITNLSADNVQDALAEIQVDIDNLTAGGSDGNDFVTSGSVSGTELTLSIPNQTNPVIDLVDIQDGFEANTDEQDLSVSGGNLNISGGTGVSLALIQDGTGTDDQEASEVDVASITNLSADNVQDALAEIQVDIDNLTAGGSDGNDFVTSGSVSGTELTLNIPNQTNPVIDLVDIQDGFEANTDEQDLSVSGGNLNISGGTGVSLALIQDGTGTDDQEASEVDVASITNLSADNVQDALAEIQVDIDNLTAGGSDGNDFVTSGSVSGTELTLNIPNQTNPVIDLVDIQDGFEANTDEQDLSVSGGNLNISGGSGVSLALIQDGTGTDDQVASEVDVASITNLSADNVQDALAEIQVDIDNLTAGGSDGNDFVTSGSVSGTELTLNIPNQTNPVIDLVDIQDGFEANTDEQDLSVSGGNLNISGGSGVSLASLQDGTGTDDQTVDLLELSGTQLRLSLEGDGEAPQTVQLSSLQDGTGTDDQVASEVDVASITNLSADNVQDALAEIQVDIDNLTAGGSDGNDFVTSGSVSGTELTLNIPNQTNPVIDLVDIQDGFEANTDEQDLSVSGGNLNISGGSGVSLASLQDGTGTDDQTVDLLELSGTQLRLSLEGDGEAPQTVQLSSLQDGFEANTDEQDLSVSGGNLNISGGSGVSLAS
ncbi:MAG: hypothetical protein AAF616_08635, partial [Bacteroidota bacterium]